MTSFDRDAIWRYAPLVRETFRARKDWPATRAHVHVYVRDVDRVYKRAVTNGAANLKEPEDRSYGNREGGFTDPSGNQWWIAQFIIEMSEKDVPRN